MPSGVTVAETGILSSSIGLPMAVEIAAWMESMTGYDEIKQHLSANQYTWLITVSPVRIDSNASGIPAALKSEDYRTG